MLRGSFGAVGRKGRGERGRRAGVGMFSGESWGREEASLPCSGSAVTGRLSEERGVPQRDTWIGLKLGHVSYSPTVTGDQK